MTRTLIINPISPPERDTNITEKITLYRGFNDYIHGFYFDVSNKLINERDSLVK